MNNSYSFLLHFLLITALALTYFIAIIIIKPFLINRKRKYSTITLKVSYLIYLATFFFTFYVFVLYGELKLEAQITDTFFILSLILLFLPNIGMMARRAVTRNRIFYNYFFSFLNMLVVFFLIFILESTEWLV